jgi:hypothetical protein
MSNSHPAIRYRVAVLARALYAREIDYATFLSQLPPVDLDKENAVTEVLDLIEHEPSRGRLLGVPPKEHAAYVADVERRIAALAAPVPESDQAI